MRTLTLQTGYKQLYFQFWTRQLSFVWSGKRSQELSSKMMVRQFMVEEISLFAEQIKEILILILKILTIWKTKNVKVNLFVDVDKTM